MFVLLLAYTAMRPGEALALTRRDLTSSERDGLPCWVVSVSAAATTGIGDDGRPVRVIGATKTAGSVRYVYLPPHLAADLQAHLDRYAAPGKGGLIFPSARDPKKVATVAQVWGSTASKRQAASGFRAARVAIGSPDLTVYDLRRWGRKLLRQAGMTDLDVEQYMGHVLGRVTDAYAVVDPEIVWPVIVRASELAGWVRPDTAPPAGLPIPARLLNAMTGPQLAAALAAMDPEQLSAVVPQLAPDTLARVFAAGALEGVRKRG